MSYEAASRSQKDFISPPAAYLSVLEFLVRGALAQALAKSVRPIQYMFSALTTGSQESSGLLSNGLSLHLLSNDHSSSIPGHLFCYSPTTSFWCFVPCSMWLVLERRACSWLTSYSMSVASQYCIILYYIMVAGDDFCVGRDSVYFMLHKYIQL